MLTAISPLPILAPPPAPAQSAADESARYEVALIKPCKDEPAGAGQRRQKFRVSAGRVNIDCLTVAGIACLAYAGVGNLAHPLLNDHGQDRNRIWAWTLQKFANQTLSNVLDRYVLDETGVSGEFNIRLEFGLDESIAVGVFGGRGVIHPHPTGNVDRRSLRPCNSNSDCGWRTLEAFGNFS
jgi:hypothetical protein